MLPTITVQRFYASRWIDVASVEIKALPERGIATPTASAYTLDYAIDNLERRDAAALSWTFPVQLDIFSRQRWPPFLVDLLPQGYGRAELLRQLELPEPSGANVEWPLLLAGAGNPIGNLRIREAREWLDSQTPPDHAHGFTAQAIAARSDDFLEFLASHGLFVAGSSGVQGEWPKILLTEAHDGLFHLDHTLPDSQAAAHWLVKFGRGPDPALARILKLESPYMRVARRLGLRVHGDLQLRERALFIPRFDRAVTPDGVQRIAQESLACFCDIAEFGAAPPHNLAVAQLARAATRPEEEVTEYVKRDVANIVLGNRDDHARNTAVHRLEDGTIRLTPVFDFAPMLLHPDGIARRMRWQQETQGAPRWSSVIEQCREATQMPLAELPVTLREFGELIAKLPEIAREESIDSDVIGRQRSAIEDAARQLLAL
jgi:serine/threonine-protein kinase HipA